MGSQQDLRSVNEITFTYAEDTTNGAYRIDRIQYTGNPTQGVSPPYEVEFVWEAKPAGEIDSGYMAGSLIVPKGAWKVGSHSWGATRKWLAKSRWPAKTGYAEKWQHVHHALVPQEAFKGTKWQAIFNQPWNLKPLEPPPGVTMDQWHKMIEGKAGDLNLNLAGRFWYGTPDWFRYAAISIFGDTVTTVDNAVSE